MIKTILLSALILLIVLMPIVIYLKRKQIQYTFFPTDEQKEIAAYASIIYKQMDACLDDKRYIDKGIQSTVDSEKYLWQKYKVKRKEFSIFKDYINGEKKYGKELIKAADKYFKIKLYNLTLAELPILDAVMEEIAEAHKNYVSFLFNKEQEWAAIRAPYEKVYWEKEKAKNSAEWIRKSREDANKQYKNRFKNNFENEESFMKEQKRRSVSKYFGECKTTDQAKMVHRKLSKLYHPDSPTGNAEMFKIVNEEYEIFMANH